MGIVVWYGLISTCTSSAYHHQGCVVKSRSLPGVHDATLCKI